jgi:hypothetical protein
MTMGAATMATVATMPIIAGAWRPARCGGPTVVGGEGFPGRPRLVRRVPF